MRYKPVVQNPSSVLVGVSGGIDSASVLTQLASTDIKTAAAMLQLQKSPYCIPETDHLNSARAIAQWLDVPFCLIDAEAPFVSTVKRYFEETYAAGLTPSPCVFCNQNIKIPLLLAHADKHHLSHVATGHYATLVQDEQDRIFVARAQDNMKDQSYYLSRIPSTMLERLLFPLARQTKAALKKNMKESFKSSIFDSLEPNVLRHLQRVLEHESTDICFVANTTYKEMLSTRIPEAFQDGVFLDTEGRVLGIHRGYGNFTVGQRKGIGLAGGPWFVKEIREKTNEIVLVKDKPPLTQTFHITDMVLNVSPSELIVSSSNTSTKSGTVISALQVQTHYRSRPVTATLTETEVGFLVRTNEPLLAAPGQVCALYDNDVVLGSGIICKGT